MIPDWRTNSVYFSALLRTRHPDLLTSLESILKQVGACVATLPRTKDIWCRDFMPVQLSEDTFCRFAYNPDYLRGYDHLKTPAAEVIPFTPLAEVEKALDRQLGVLDLSHIGREAVEDALDRRRGRV